VLLLKGQQKIDEFAFILLAGIVMLLVMVIGWSAMEQGALAVSPTSKTLSIAKGDLSSFRIYINGTAKNVTLIGSGDVGSWFSFDKNYFDVSGPTEVTVLVNVPRSAQEKFYTGIVELTYTGGKNTVSVTVNVSTTTISDLSRTIPLPDFSVKYLVGSETVEERDNFDVSQGYFSESSTSFAGILTEEKQSIVTGGSIHLIIDETNEAGNLIVEFNDKEVFNGRAGVGERTISLEKDQILKSNSIKIKAGSPGWKFWMNSAYKIRTAEFIIEYNGVFFKDFSFILDNSEAVNFKFGKIRFKLKDYDPNRLPNMIIKINDKEIFDGAPRLTGSQVTEKTFDDVPLNIGSNSLSFSLDEDGFYDLEDVSLTIVRNV
jgi:hypothetical protein